jgi:hypothetical protein
MDRNPYAAPSAPVSDPLPQPIERPPQVKWAVQLLWLTLLLGVASLIANPRKLEGVELIATIAGGAVMVGLEAWLIVKIASGRNWARIVYLILTVLGFASIGIAWQTYVATFSASALTAVLYALQTVTEIAALYLLFTKPGARWFKR